MFFAYAVAFVVGFLLALLLLGYASPRRYQIKVQRTLPAPPDRVWPFLAEPTRFPRWFPYVESCELAGGPATGTGQRRKLVLDLGGVRGEREEEAGRWDDNRFLELVHLREQRAGRPVRWTDARNEFRLEPVPGGTSFTGVMWFSGRGMLGRIFSLLFFRKMHERHLRMALANLEQRLREGGSPASS